MDKAEASKIELERHRKYYSLTEWPEFQARAIAEHYTKYAVMAQSMLVLLESMVDGKDTKERMEAVEMMCTRIKEGHWEDLGIELVWKKGGSESKANFLIGK